MLFNAYLLKITLTAHLFKKQLNLVLVFLNLSREYAGQLNMTSAMFCSKIIN